MKFANKHVLVLGGTGSIGSVIADQFVACGATVYRHGLKDGDYQADLTDESKVAAMMEAVLGKAGTIDVLVNSVSAPVEVKRFEQKTWADYQRHIDVQMKSAVQTAQAVLPGMKEQKAGRIIHILTTYADGETPSSLGDYVSAKYAMLGLTKCMAKEFGRYDITVNAVSPSFVKNNFTKEFPDKLSEIIIHQTPLKRLATGEDVAHAVLYLASEEAGFVTGENIHVTGGSHL